MEHKLYYALVRAVPDPARGERLNIGVIAWDPTTEGGATRFAWSRPRLRALGLEDETPLVEFRDWLNSAIALKGNRLFDTGAGANEQWSLAAMRRAEEWGGVVQVSDTRPALAESPQALADTIYNRSVQFHDSGDRAVPARAALRREIARIVRQTVTQSWPENKTPLAVRVSHDVMGATDRHAFDVTLTNGRVVAAIATLNLENPRVADVKRDIEAATWSIHDIRTLHGDDVDFAVYATTTSSKRLRNAMNALVSSQSVERLNNSAAVVSFAQHQRARVLHAKHDQRAAAG